MGDSSKPPRRLSQAEIDLIRRALGRFGVPGTDLDDTTSEVLLDLTLRLPGSDPTKSVAAWCQGFARLGARAYRRRKSRTAWEVLVADPDDFEVSQGAPDPQEHAMSRQDLAALDALLDELAPSETEALLLYEGTAMEMADVAAALGLPPGTAASRVHRARKNLHAARARLQARQGTSRAAFPPLWILFGGSQPSGGAAELVKHSGAAARASSLGAAAPWLAAGLLGALVATSTIAVGAVLVSRCDPGLPPAPIAPAAISESAALPAPSATIPTPAGTALPPVMSAAPAPSAREVPRDELSAEEIHAQIRAARTSFARGDAAAALLVLERLDRREHRGLVARSRELLRIEVLARLGRRAEAERRLARLRKTSPDDPRLKRLEEILSASP